MATWPAALPKPLGEDYSLAVQDVSVRTDMDAGPARVRRRFTAAPDTVNLSWKFTEAEMATFRAFYEDDIDYGAAWFNLSLKDGRAAGMATKEVRFAGPYNAAYIAGYGWHVSAAMEVRVA